MKSVFFCLVILISLFTSCEQSELEFSCDPKMNELVVKNRDELAKISTEELFTYDIRFQRAIFNSWDNQKKRSVWINKLQQVLATTPLTQIERVHIQKLIEHVVINYFEKDNIINDLESRSQFAASWIKYAVTELKWQKQFIDFLVYRLYDDETQFISELSNLKKADLSTNTNPEYGNCDCNTSSDFCNGIGCYSGSCNITTGCGWLWSASCNGNCN